MALIRFEQVSFAYPKGKTRALNKVSFSVEEGEYIVVCGESGCGKTTLLKQMKRELTPSGAREGHIFYKDCLLEALDGETASMKIGFVQQNPDAQIVTDTVWRELAFGLENQGLPTEVIRRRVSELASFFGMESWFRRKTSDLSGGQKQMLNLASILAMNPDLLILDEPTSMLDPLASKELLDMILRVNRELGVAVFMCEHQLEDVFAVADRILMMKQGEILAFDTPEHITTYIAENKEEVRVFKGLPAAVQIFGRLRQDGCYHEGTIPLQIRQARLLIQNMNLDMVCKEYREASKDDFNGEQVLKGKELWFAYEKGGTNTLRSLDVELKKGEILSLVGGNGAGKSTLLKVLSGVLKPYRGKIKKDKTKNLAMLPQSPQALFTSEELLEDLLEGAFAGQRNEKKNKNRDEAEAEAISMAKQFGLEHKLDAHPFDLSGGEMQRAAIAKLLLTKARILLLDEPTKGLDGYLKNELGKLLQNLAAQGISILMVTHDLDFSAEYSHRCAMLFDGQIISVDEPHRFFAGNRFYTTAANQIAGNSVKGAILVEEVVECLESILQETRQ